MAVSFVVYAILWRMPFVHHVLAPLKILVVTLHEFCHAFTGCITCGRVHSIEVNYDEGGKTEMSGGM